jgi:hypothetical protein
MEGWNSRKEARRVFAWSVVDGVGVTTSQGRFSVTGPGKLLRRAA